MRRSIRPLPLAACLLTLLPPAAAQAPAAQGTHLGVLRAELACRPLPSFPFVQYPRAFHEGGGVHAAVDPARFPELVGRTFPLYVVASATQRAWRADARLVDVRGAPQSVTVRAGSIALNTFDLNAAALSGDAGIGLGVGYDVVLDLDASGTLGWGDVIDGWSEPGFFVVRDTTLPGPSSVVEALYSGGLFLGQKLYFPADIAQLGKRPLIVVSHGNGHNFQWYDHIGRHLASWGYVVMSHENNTGPGVGQAAKTTIDNTDYFIESLDLIAGGALLGHVDLQRIAWLGHSRGGEGVVRAYQRALTGSYAPKNFVPADVKLLASMAPVTSLAGNLSTPADVPFWLIYGASDTDVVGSPGNPSVLPFALYERAFGPKHSTYVQGVGHAWFHDKPGVCFCTGPALLNRKITHQVLLGYLLPLVAHHLEGNVPALDFFERHYQDFHPLGIDPAAVVAGEHRDALAAGNFVLDDFQTNAAITLSSSGGLVTTDAADVYEGALKDGDNSFAYVAGAPANGMTRQSDPAFDLERGVVLEWAPGTGAFYELELVPAERDLSDDGELAFRACQETRHPWTDLLDAGLTFAVTLRDGRGTESTIDLGNYGAVTRTYERSGAGAGQGWANEFTTYRLRLRDFALDGSGLDLTDVAAVRFDFGLGFGPSPGRVGLDDIQITRD